MSIIALPEKNISTSFFQARSAPDPARLNQDIDSLKKLVSGLSSAQKNDPKVVLSILNQWQYLRQQNSHSKYEASGEVLLYLNNRKILENSAVLKKAFDLDQATCQELKRLGIEYIERLGDKDTALKIIRNRQNLNSGNLADQPLAVVFYGKDDSNGAFFYNNNIKELTEQGYCVLYFEAGDDPGALRQLKQLKSGLQLNRQLARVFILGGHGQEGDFVWSQGWGEDKIFDIYDTEFKILGSCVASNSVFIIDSCLNAAGGKDNPYNVIYFLNHTIFKDKKLTLIGAQAASCKVKLIYNDQGSVVDARILDKNNADITCRISSCDDLKDIIGRLIKQNKLKAAYALLDKITSSLNPADVQAWFLKGEINYRLGYFQNALTCYAKGKEFSPELTLKRKADIYYQWSQNPAVEKCDAYRDFAYACYHELTRLDPQDYTAWYRKGQILYLNYLFSNSADPKKFKIIVDCFENALRIDKLNPKAWQALAEVYLTSAGRKCRGYKLMQEKLSLSLAYSQQALKLDPEFAKAWQGMGDALYFWARHLSLTAADKNSKIDLAIKAHQKALELDAQNCFGSYKTLGDIYYRQREYLAAKNAYQKFLKLTPFPVESEIFKKLEACKRHC